MTPQQKRVHAAVMEQVYDFAEKRSIPFSHVRVFVGAVCDHCGTACVAQEPNMIREAIECVDCGETTPITVERLSCLFEAPPRPGATGPRIEIDSIEEKRARRAN